MAFLQELRRETYAATNGAVDQVVTRFKEMTETEIKKFCEDIKQVLLREAKMGNDSLQQEWFRYEVPLSDKGETILRRPYFRYESVYEKWFSQTRASIEKMSGEPKRVAIKRFNDMLLNLLHYLSEEWRKFDMDVIVSVYDITNERMSDYGPLAERKCGLRFVWNYAESGELYLALSQVQKYESKFKRAILNHDAALQAAIQTGHPVSKKIKL